MSKFRGFFLGVIGIAVCIGVAGLVSANDSTLTRGAELLQPFKKNLKQALLKGLEDGPEQAIDVCKDKAPKIAKELSVDGVLMGRSSHRLRNPSNEGPDWVTPVLEAYVTEPSSLTPVTVQLPSERIGYVEPIKLQPVCLVCHGSAVPPSVQATLEQQYPSDQATGFEIDELRGVFWAEFPAPKPGSPE